jgi:uncharacterized membrane protein SpoIIM required for sporulation
MLFGLEFMSSLVGEKYYTLWFILNNLVVMLVVIAASVFILTRISSRPRFLEKKFKGFKNFSKFRNVERRRPKMTLFSLYMVPVGALILNGFLIALFATYVFLTYGQNSFTALALLVPHGINEVIALILAASLGVSYLKVMSPLILRGNMKGAIAVGGRLLRTKATFYVIVIILTLIVFSGFVEGALSLFAIK